MSVLSIIGIVFLCLIGLVVLAYIIGAILVFIESFLVFGLILGAMDGFARSKVPGSPGIFSKN